jgi:SAM-dependent methyltransferase
MVCLRRPPRTGIEQLLGAGQIVGATVRKRVHAVAYARQLSIHRPGSTDPEGDSLASRAQAGSELLEVVVACPVCHSRLVWESTGVRCQSCSRFYARAETGAPILLVGDALALEEVWYPGALRLLPASLRRFAERHRGLVCPTLTYRSPNRRGLVAKFVATLTPTAAVANVGGGSRRYGPNVVNIDVEPLPGVDVVGVAEQLPLADGTCDGAVLQAVLEHVRSADLTLRELHRVLKPGGSLFIEVPFMQGYHPSPGDYRRYTEQGLRAELIDHEFDIQESGVAVGPASAMAWVAAEFLAFVVSGRSERVYRLARPVSRWLTQPIKYADRWLDTHPMAHTIPSGVWARAVRRE